MITFDFYNPTHLLFGVGKLNELHSQQMPGRKALLLISNGDFIVALGGGAVIDSSVAVAVMATNDRAGIIPYDKMEAFFREKLK